MINKVSELVGDIYACGGSVRDNFLNRTPKDYDFTTSLLPDEIQAKIKQAGRRVYITGKRFGTLGVKIDGHLVEITTFRTETYTNTRKPDVKFTTDIIEDLSRRDFTINAMAMDIKGNLIDPFKGRVDIITKTIRCVGVPKHRFKEDPLRILRAARFASELGFNIDNLTFSTMEKMSINLLRVSKERWCQELDKILLSDTPSIGLDYLMKCNVFNYILPELSLQYKYNQDSPYHSHDLWTHTKIVVDNAENDLYVRWAALLHDIGKPFLATLNKRGYHNYINHEILGGELVKKIGCYLKRSNEWIDKVTILVLEHMKENSPLKEADNKGK